MIGLPRLMQEMAWPCLKTRTQKIISTSITVEVLVAENFDPYPSWFDQIFQFHQVSLNVDPFSSYWRTLLAEAQ